MQERIERIIKILDAKKAEAIEAIDMSEREYIAKCVIIATTMGDLKEELKDAGEQFLGIESSGDWVVIDLGDILIHLMSAQYRAKYNIEEFLSKLKEAKA